VLGDVERAVFSDVPITATFRLRLPLAKGEVHALGGVGLHVASLRSTHDLAGVQVGSTWSSTSAFGFHVGAGAAFQVWRTTYVGLEARRSFVPARFDGVDTRIDGLTAAVTISYQL
jgi:opacity protein-like surface antigen